MATPASTRPGAVPASRPSAAPRSVASRNTRVSAPACDTTAEWKRSAPPAGARHWKNITPAEPRATWARLCRVIRPGSLVCIRPAVWIWLGALSASSHGAGRPAPWRAQPRARSAANAVCSSAPRPAVDG